MFFSQQISIKIKGKVFHNLDENILYITARDNEKQF